MLVNNNTRRGTTPCDAWAAGNEVGVVRDRQLQWYDHGRRTTPLLVQHSDLKLMVQNNTIEPGAKYDQLMQLDDAVNTTKWRSVV